MANENLSMLLGSVPHTIPCNCICGGRRMTEGCSLTFDADSVTLPCLRLVAWWMRGCIPLSRTYIFCFYFHLYYHFYSQILPLLRLVGASLRFLSHWYFFLLFVGTCASHRRHL